MSAAPSDTVLDRPRGRRPWWRIALLASALAGIIYALLRPMYGDYADRAQVAEAVSLLIGARTALLEQYANTGAWPADLPGGPQVTSGRYTRSLAITRGGDRLPEIELTATLRDTGVDRRVAGKTVRLYTRDGGKSWTCRAGTAPERSLPAACRDGG